MRGKRLPSEVHAAIKQQDARENRLKKQREVEEKVQENFMAIQRAYDKTKSFIADLFNNIKLKNNNLNPADEKNSQQVDRKIDDLLREIRVQYSKYPTVIDIGNILKESPAFNNTNIKDLEMLIQCTHNMLNFDVICQLTGVANERLAELKQKELEQPKQEAAAPVPEPVPQDQPEFPKAIKASTSSSVSSVDPVKIEYIKHSEFEIIKGGIEKEINRQLKDYKLDRNNLEPKAGDSKQTQIAKGRVSALLNAQKRIDIGYNTLSRSEIINILDQATAKMVSTQKYVGNSPLSIFKSRYENKSDAKTNLEKLRNSLEESPKPSRTPGRGK